MLYYLFKKQQIKVIYSLKVNITSKKYIIKRIYY